MRVERIESPNDAVILRFAGIVTDDSQRLLSPAELTEADFARRVLFCLRDVTLLNSTGIGFLLKLNKQVKDRGGKLILINLPPYVRQVIDFMKLAKVLSIAKSEAEAFEMLK